MKKSILVMDGLYVFFIAVESYITFGRETYISNRAVDRSMILFAIIGVIFGIITLIYTIRSCSKFYMVDVAEAFDLVKFQKNVRLIRIPGYLAVFLLGFALFLSFVNIYYAFAMIIADLISISLTGMASIGVYNLLYKNNLITKSQRTLYSIVSFLYIWDVLVALVCYSDVKSRLKMQGM